MSEDSKRGEHTRLVLGMADRQGLDLEAMILRAEFTEEQFEQAVDKCMGCTQSVACRCLLDNAGPSLDLPEYCRNGDVFQSLKPQ